MQLVAALDKDPEFELCLAFEGVVTGAADGFARMTDTPALTYFTLDRVMPMASPTFTMHRERACLC